MELGTALALVGLVDLIIKYGEKLIERCKAYAHAEQALVELTIRLQNRWYKVKAQVSVLKERANELEQSFLLIQSKTLHVLESKLCQADISVQHLMPAPREQGVMTAVVSPFLHMKPPKMSSKAKTQYALQFKTLNGIVDSIKDWQAEFDPSWYFTIVMLKKTLDDAKHDDTQDIVRRARAFQEARIGVQPPGNGPNGQVVAAQALPADGVPETNIFVHPDILSLDKRPLLYSPFSVTEEIIQNQGPVPGQDEEDEQDEKDEEEADEEKLIIVETVKYGPYIDIDQTTSDIRRLARVLLTIDPMVFGLLRCRGVISSHHDAAIVPPGAADADKDAVQMSILFSVPEGLDTPRSFRRVLINQTPSDLNQRIDLAKRLSNAVSFVHTSGFVHKNVRPETILLFSVSDRNNGNNNINGTSSQLGHAFLVGFSEFRLAEGQSYLRGDDIMARNIYRHPSRQGSRPYIKHTMQHDIYSLGVCLLEIGLWFSFVEYTEDSRGCIRPEISSRLKSDMPVPDQIWTEKDAVKRATTLKTALAKMADARLPGAMGREYANLTVSCLTCLDDDAGVLWEEDGGDGGGHVGVEKDEGQGQGQDQAEGVVVGVRFIQHVIQRIHDIHV